MCDTHQFISRRYRHSRLMLMASLLVCIPAVVESGEPQSSQTEQIEKTPATTAPTTTTPSKAATDQTDGDGKRQNKLQIVQGALLLLTGIVLVGLLLLGLIILWGVRVRREARKRLPAQQAVDELWYLKPEKQVAASDAVEDAGDESDTGDPEST